MKKKVEVSVIIPVRTITHYVEETISFLQKQTQKNFETIIVTDKQERYPHTRIFASKEPLPSYKRNLGAKKASGAILAFLDDDSYPNKFWIENALKIFNEDPLIAAVCGPILTPPTDSLYQKASGWVWASKLGSGGAGVYRSRIMPRREVEDFPAVNLLVRKEDFNKIGGFDINHWPGEDTKLCLYLVKLGKKIIYDPAILVYHHRRSIFLPHLKQISRYALRRGLFARIYPETSFKVGYLIPSFFSFGLFLGAVLLLFIPFLKFIYIPAVFAYFLLLLVSGIEVLIKEKNIYLMFLVIVAIFLTHLVYGCYFPFGYFSSYLESKAHEVDLKRKSYVGG